MEKNQFQDFVDNTVIGVYRSTPGGRILLANPALLDMLGYQSFEELASRDLEDDGFEASYPRQRFKELMDRHGEVRGFEAAWRRKDGRVVYLSENARAVRDSGGTIQYYEGTVEDITERKRMEEELRREKDRTQSYLDVAGVMLFGCDPEGRITMVNRKGCEIMGYLEAELLGKKWYRRFLDESMQELGHQIIRAVAAGDLGPFEYIEIEVKTKSGATKTIAVHNRLLRDPDGRIVGTVTSGEDITHRRVMENRLDRKMTELTEFNRVAVGRELRMIELKREINQLRRQQGLEPAYQIVE